jgi:hypothetical protein
MDDPRNKIGSCWPYRPAICRDNLMSQDPNSQFDSTVLEMIEHSAVGAVPTTPSYQDALNRLRAAHKVYADADHKDGHVTARSLARLPNFHAGNLGSLVAGTIEPAALESNFSIFDRYVRSLPAALRGKAEGFRAKVAGRPALHRKHHAGGDKPTAAHDLVHSLFMVPGTGPHPGVTGNYLFGSIMEMGAGATVGSWAVQVHDCDDGAAAFTAANMKEALAKLQEVLDSAPFNMNELGGLDFKVL